MSENTASISRDKGLNREKIILICMFIVYAALTFIGAANHELWFNEGQAWNIARDNDIPGIIAQMKLEGHPPLWHFILYIFTSAGCPADIMPFISWFISCVTAALLLWKAPFKPLMKGITLFSGGFLFYWSVVSRSYCLIALLLVIIAIAYKSRNEQPVVFGLLVALLANTHIMMCGLVGIIGIYMIIDLFQLWKSSPMKKNILRLVGLAVAGIGVIALILPLIGSIGANDYTAKKVSGLTVQSVLWSLFTVFGDISSAAVFDLNTLISPAVTLLVSFMLGLVFVAALVFLRHFRRSFIMLLVFTAFFAVICNVIWCIYPPRAEIFVFTFLAVYWIAVQSEKPVYREPKPMNEKVSELGAKLIGWLRRIDKGFDKSFCVVICAYMAATIPMGAYQLFSDYAMDYSYSKSTAEFIRENLPADSVFVTKNESGLPAQYISYLPEYKFYSMNRNSFYTYYDLHIIEGDEPIDYEQVYEDLKGYEHLYLLDMSVYGTKDEAAAIYSRNGVFSQWISQSDKCVRIYELDLEAEVAKNIE